MARFSVLLVSIILTLNSSAKVKEWLDVKR